MTEITQVGFIGLGVMGLPMLCNLTKQSRVDIRAFDLSDTPFETLKNLPIWGNGLSRAGSLADLAQCSHVITMLPDSRSTNRVILGEDGPGLTDHLRAGATIIDMGSSDPTETLRLLPILTQKGIRLIDAPVSGAAAKARTGELSIMVGGDAALVQELRPILSGMGHQLIATGKPGAAHAMKALNNYVYAAGLLAVSEALSVIEAMKLDGAIFADILNASSGRNVASETKLRQFLLPRDYAGGFALRLQAKDLQLAEGLRRLTEARAPQLSLCAALWAEAVTALPDGADNTAIHRFLQSALSDKD